MTRDSSAAEQGLHTPQVPGSNPGPATTSRLTHIAKDWYELLVPLGSIPASLNLQDDLDAVAKHYAREHGLVARRFGLTAIELWVQGQLLERVREPHGAAQAGPLPRSPV